MTLVELLVVLVILVALAAIVIPALTNLSIRTPVGGAESPQAIATRTTIQRIHASMTGEGGVIETLAHNSNALPRRICELTNEKAPEYLSVTAPALIEFDPVNQVGWNGPYLFATGHNSRGEPTLVDGWGTELELQVDFNRDGEIDRTEATYMRVVSAGPNGQIETPGDSQNMKPGENEFHELALSECGDDLVVFIRTLDNRKH